MNNSVGIIGLGEMGSVMAKGFAMTGVVPQNDLYIFDRHTEKVQAIKDEFPDVNVCENQIEVAKNSRYLIISIQPSAIPVLVNELSEYITVDTNLFLSSSNVLHDDIKKLFNGKITTFLPTVNSAILRGVIFACHNEKVTDNEKQFFDRIMGAICKSVRIVKEDDFPVLDNLSGCMPAFLATFLCTFVNRALESAKNPNFNFSKEELKLFAQETFIASGMLLEKQQLDIEDIVGKVGHPGGITFAALSAFDEVLPNAVNDLFDRSGKKHQDTRVKVKGIVDSIVESKSKT